MFACSMYNYMSKIIDVLEMLAINKFYKSNICVKLKIFDLHGGTYMIYKKDH